MQQTKRFKISLLNGFLIFGLGMTGFAPNAHADPLQVGAAAINITPAFEGHPPTRRKNFGWKKGDPFYDTGIDGKFDYEEPGAFGADGKPGVAGVDDDGNGLIDDCTRESCAEYGFKNSDDRADPNGDNYNKKYNKAGTEGDRKFQFVHLAGFSPYYPAFVANRLATGVHDPIWARALALHGSNSTPLILISTDLPGLAWKHINPVRRRLAREFNIPIGNIVIASTHVHSAPDAIGYWVTLLKGRNRAYTDQLRQWMYEAGAQAFRTMKPATMRTITTTHFSCRDRLTGELKKDPNCRIPNFAYVYKQAGWEANWDEEIVQNDKRDPIVRNTNIIASQFVAVDGSGTIATFMNYNNHPDTLGGGNMLISSDFVGFARDFLEAELGGIAVYFSGTVGCQIGSSQGVPVPQWTADRHRVNETDGKFKLITEGWDRIQSMGYEIAHEAVQALRAAPFQSKADITVLTENMTLKVDNFLHNLATGSVWTKDVEKPDRMRKFVRGCWSRHGCVATDVDVIQVGDLGIVTAPGEVDPSYLLGREASVADYGKKGHWHFPAQPGWTQHMPGTHHAVLGQANNYLSYLIHRADYVGWWNFKHPNHYEDLVTINPKFGDTVGNRIMKMLGSNDRFEGKAVTGGPALGDLTTGGPKWLEDETLKRMNSEN